MSAENKTEQATPRRRQKAREKGQVARSKEISAALATAGALAVVAWQANVVPAQWAESFRDLLHLASRPELRPWIIVHSVFLTTLRLTAPAMALAAIFGTAGSVVQGGFVWAPSSLAPTFSRLNPATRFSQLISVTALANLLKSLVPFGAIAYIVVKTLASEWLHFAGAVQLGPRQVTYLLVSVIGNVAWKAVLVLLLWAGLDYWLVRSKLESDLRMTKQEVRDEAKETEGNALVKGRIRRLQRQVRRNRMLQNVQQATVVVTNPTHFAIALKWDAEMAAPIVLAKGRNFLAQQIKQAAAWHGIAMVENPPLAHVLYRTVDVGQVIPAKLYSAVAEILAFVYRNQQREVSRSGGTS